MARSRSKLGLVLATLVASPLALSAAAAASSSAPVLSVSVSPTAGNYTVFVDGAAWYSSPTGPSAFTVCVAGNTSVPLAFVSATAASGTDFYFGAWTGTVAQFRTTDASSTPVVYTLKTYTTPSGGSGSAPLSSPAVLTASFPSGLDTSGCGPNTKPATRFPSFDTGAGRAPSLWTLSWQSTVLQDTATAVGLAKLGQTNALDLGPVVSYDPSIPSLLPTLVWSTLDSHKIIVQETVNPPTPSPVTSLWSATRQDQVACLSQLCGQDQVSDGNYTSQRVEGYGLLGQSVTTMGKDGSTATVTYRGKEYAAVALRFAWSSEHNDNW
jgi:hypothetical protein